MCTQREPSRPAPRGRWNSWLPAAMTMAALLCSCQGTYRKAPTGGYFTGEPRMVAIAPNTFFFYQPKGKDIPFSFTTAKAAPGTLQRQRRGRGSYQHPGLTITPEPMFTTGASVPRHLWFLPGFSGFDFTRAALIHDWLYEAHHRYEMARESGDVKTMKAYERYANISQNDAADIFAECMKVTMEESQNLRGDFKALGDRHLDQMENIRDLQKALANTRPSAFKLATYHYFVSDDCLIPTSRDMWRKRRDNIGFYKLIADGPTGDYAVKRGYLSPWLRGRFREIYEAEVEREKKYQQVERQDQLALQRGTLQPRIYLEVADTATEAAILRYRNTLAQHHFQTKTTALSTDLDSDELRVLYYRPEDAAEAEQLKELVESWLPSESRPARARTTLVKGATRVRPKHYDLRVGPALAGQFIPPAR